MEKFKIKKGWLMNSIERVERAFWFENLDWLTMFFNKDKKQGDIVMSDVQKHYGGKDRLTSEWVFQ